MKFITLIALFICTTAQSPAQNPNKDYDSVLAKKLNADAYGMKKYYLVMLKTGTATITDKARLDSIFGGHMKNIQLLASQNKLFVAGPLGKNDNSYRGIFILNTESKEEAEKMLEADTAVKMKVLAADYYLWYGSAALQELPAIDKKLAKENF
ncbi:MAG: hypothetical protein ABIU11_04540 [Chitinophagaceae bacterium]